jgi:tRNA(fMet)-specific endonuclease VapC
VTTALDSNVTIALLRRKSPTVRQRFMDAVDRGVQLHVSLIVFHELMYGVARSQRPDQHRAEVRFLLLDMSVEPLSESDVIAAADTRADLSRRGVPIGPFDALIAGQALNRRWTLVTANTREFARVPGLTVEDWSAAAP